MSKVFLGGTCNNTNWREKIISQIKMDYFNPIVEDWTPECQQIEMEEKENKCDVHLYVITKEMTGVFSIVETIDSVHNKNVQTILHIIPDGFEESQLKSLQATVNLVNLRGGNAYIDNNIQKSIDVINNLYEENKNLNKKNRQKELYFYFILYHIIDQIRMEKNQTINDFNESNNLGHLKIQKLLFFFITFSKNNKQKLLPIFNNYYVSPFGHIEADIKNIMLKKENIFFEFTAERIKIKNNPMNILISESENLLSAIKKFLNDYSNIIDYTLLRLIEINHNYFTWMHYYKKAQSLGKFNHKVPIKDIIDEPLLRTAFFYNYYI